MSYHVSVRNGGAAFLLALSRDCLSPRPRHSFMRRAPSSRRERSRPSASPRWASGWVSSSPSCCSCACSLARRPASTTMAWSSSSSGRAGRCGHRPDGDMIDTWSYAGLPRCARRRQRHGHHGLEPRRRPRSIAGQRRRDTGADDVRVEQLFLDHRRRAAARARIHAGRRCVARRTGSRHQPSGVAGALRQRSQHHRARDHGQPVRIRRRRRGAGRVSAATSAALDDSLLLNSGCRCRVIRV